MNDHQIQRDNPILSTSRITDRRGASRTPLMLTAWIWLADAADGIAVRLLDHSQEGVGFVSPLPLTKGESFELSLDHAGGRRTVLLVANCEFVGDNAYRIGAFTVPSADDESGTSEQSLSR